MIEVTCNDRLGKKIRVKCNPDDTVGDLKKMVSAQTGTRPDKIVLKKWYTIFKDHIQLQDYEIHDGMNLELYYQWAAGFPIQTNKSQSSSNSSPKTSKFPYRDVPGAQSKWTMKPWRKEAMHQKINVRINDDTDAKGANLFLGNVSIITN